jgi:predicted enzyme related to lactoylglutathione lyase
LSTAHVVILDWMITAVHTLVYADDVELARAFFRDVLQLPNVDTGGGWLIFKTGPSELGVHPTSQELEGSIWSTPEKHEISLVCDDIEATVADLKSRGAVFTREIRDDGFGLTIEVEVPGGPGMMIYEPRYDPPALTL